MPELSWKSEIMAPAMSRGRSVSVNGIGIIIFNPELKVGTMKALIRNK